MKKLFNLLMVSLFLFLTSCGGGWTDEQLNVVKNDCVMQGKYDCDCYVKNAKKIFKNPTEYNKTDSKLHEKFEKAIAKCKVEEKKVEKDTTIESF